MEILANECLYFRAGKWMFASKKEKEKEGIEINGRIRYTRYEAEGGAHVPLSKHLAPPWSPVWRAPWPGPPVAGAVEQNQEVRHGGGWGGGGKII